MFDDMITKPVDELLASYFPRCHVQNYFFLILSRSFYLKPVQQQKNFHSSMTDSFVPIHEGVVVNDGEAKGSCFLRYGAIQVLSTESHPGLC